MSGYQRRDLVGLALLFSLLTLQSANAKIRILDVEAAAQRLDSFTVLDAREDGPFRRGHLPGSQNLSWKEWTQEKANLLNLFLGDPAKWGRVAEADSALQARLQKLGLSATKPILVVGSPHEWGEEGRIAWNCLYWGARDVALLDGGFPAWAAAGKKVEKGAAKAPPPGDFVVQVHPERRVSWQSLKGALNSKTRVILDARTPEEYAGKVMAGQTRGGHIPGARLVPELSLYQPDGRYVDAATLKRLIGVPLKRPISYCTGGVRSALLALLVEARLGIPTANYDGSIWEWASKSDLPLVTKD